MARPRRHRITIDANELNLVPLLDMISLLIQVLLVNIQFGTLAQIEAEQAAAAAPSEEPAPSLELDVGVDDAGYQIAWTEGGQRVRRELPCKAPCAAGQDYDAVGLRGLLAELKRDHAEELAGVISPAGPIPFDVIATTMGAMRADARGEPLFPDLVVADGR